MNKWLDRYKDEIAGNDVKVGKKAKRLTANSAKSHKSDLLAVLAVTDSKVHNKFTTTTFKKLDTLRPLTAKSAKSLTEVISNFVQLVKQVGIDNQIVLDEVDIISELDKPEELQNIDKVTLISWSTAVGLRLVRERGLVPQGWTRIAYKYHCTGF